MRVTLKQVAAASKVAVSTVGDILGKRAHLYKEATRRKVFDAARRLGYRPNASARSMQSGKFDCLCLLQSAEEWRGYLPQSMLQGFQEAMHDRGMHLTISTLPDDKLNDETYVPKILREVMADGLLINYIDAIPKHLMSLIRKNDVPSVWINVKHATDCIHPDDYGGARTATEWLIASGRERIAYVDLAYLARAGHYSKRDRRNGCLEALRDAGREEVSLTRPHPTPGHDTLAFALEALSGSRRPDAVVTYGPADATTLLHGATFLGMRVPDDLAIISFCESDLHEARKIPVGTVVVDWRRMGREAVGMLLQRIDAPEESFPARAMGLAVRTEGLVASGEPDE